MATIMERAMENTRRPRRGFTLTETSDDERGNETADSELLDGLSPDCEPASGGQHG